MMYLCRPAMTQCVKHKARGPYLARPIGLSGSVSIILHFSCMSLSTVRSNWIIVWNQTPQLHMQRSLLSVTTLLTTALFYFPRILPERKWDYWRKKEKKHVGKKRKMYSVTLKCLLINDSNIEIYGLAERCRSRSFQSLLPRWRTFICFLRPLFFTVSPIHLCHCHPSFVHPLPWNVTQHSPPSEPRGPKHLQSLWRPLPSNIPINIVWTCRDQQLSSDDPATFCYRPSSFTGVAAGTDTHSVFLNSLAAFQQPEPWH